MNYIYMFDEFSIPLWIHTLFWLLYIIPFLFFFKKLVLNKEKEFLRTRTKVFFTLYFIVYAIFYCIDTDYFSYRDWMYDRDLTFWNKEMVYMVLIQFCKSLPTNYPYEFFRLIVWGGAILIVCLSAWQYRRHFNPGLAIVFLFILYSSTFSYARASLAMSVYFAGLSLFLNVQSKAIKTLAVILICSSYFLHHEMIVGICLLPCLFIPFERKSVFLLSVLVILIVIVNFPFFLNVNYLSSIFDNDDISSQIEHFNNKEQRVFRLSTLVCYLTHFYPFYLITTLLWKKKFPYSVTKMYRVIYGILAVSITFMVVSGPRSVFTYRVLFISMIPLTLLVDYCYCIGYFKKKHLLIMMALALLSNSVRFINA